jgi:hypothetical protein
MNALWQRDYSNYENDAECRPLQLSNSNVMVAT